METTVKLGIRALCEFVLRCGDIDSRFSGTDRAADGARIHKKLQKRENYKAEVHFKTTRCVDAITYLLEGRADGLFYEDGVPVIEEIKTTTVAVQFLTENYSEAHWAQGICYAMILCENENYENAKILLTYYQADTDEIVRYTRSYTKGEMQAYVDNLLHLYAPWAVLSADWCKVRNESIKQTDFPFTAYRSGQYEMARAVYRTIQGEDILLGCAPTGTGKTIATLFPAIKAMGEEKCRRIFYLTAKTITRTAAEGAVELLRKDKPLRIKALTLTAKEKVCFLDERNCTPDACPYAKGYYDRINNSILQLLSKSDNFSRESITEFAKRYTLCPFELALDLSLWCDVIICDYNYLFDPVVQLKRFFERERGDYVFLIDEAHNLADRAREMYSATLNKSDIYALKKEFTGGNRYVLSALKALNQLFISTKKEFEKNTDVMVNVQAGKELAAACGLFINAASKWLDENKESPLHKKVLELYFAARFYNKIYDFYDDNYTTLCYKTYDNLYIKLFCLDPAVFIKSCLDIGTASVLFSATIIPFDYFEKTLGTDGCKHISLYSPFPKENFCLMCACDISTKYDNRENSLQTVAAMIYAVQNGKAGNYIAFFPSYKYLHQVYEKYCELYPLAKTIIQSNSMSEDAREEFLANFCENPSEGFVGFCVMGGIFSEGIDLAGNRLIGSIIVGVGLPQVGAEQNQLRNYYEDKGFDGFGFAYQLPGFNKVLQAAGRVIRTASDKGVVLLIDSRYNTARYKQLFPPHWQHCKFIHGESQLKAQLDAFWQSNK